MLRVSPIIIVATNINTGATAAQLSDNAANNGANMTVINNNIDVTIDDNPVRAPSAIPTADSTYVTIIV